MFGGEKLKKKVIPLIPEEQQKNKSGSTAPAKIKVAAYCRVSRDKDAQLNSLDVQRRYFEDLLFSHPECENAGVFMMKEYPLPA